jgi:hypothetical protein
MEWFESMMTSSSFLEAEKAGLVRVEYEDDDEDDWEAPAD